MKVSGGVVVVAAESAGGGLVPSEVVLLVVVLLGWEVVAGEVWGVEVGVAFGAMWEGLGGGR